MINKAEDYIEERTRLYQWLKRVEVGALSVEELRTLDGELLVRGLVLQDGAGEVRVTQKGRQFVFQFECERALQVLERHGIAPADARVGQWLVSERFVLEPTRSHAQWEVTARGRTWLESLTQLPEDIDLSS